MLPILHTGCRDAGGNPSSLWGEGRDTPWTDHLFIAGPNRERYVTINTYGLNLASPTARSTQFDSMNEL